METVATEKKQKRAKKENALQRLQMHTIKQ